MKIFRLNEGITHIEDLSIDKFINTIKNLFDYNVSEKIDGANLWFGRDTNGNLFTTREQKSADKDRKFQSKDYHMVSAYNGFRSAHDALENFFGSKTDILKPNETFEIEVVFGKQPNVVKYSDDGVNYIVILRPVNGTSEESFKRIVAKVENKETTVQSKIIDTVDGKSLMTSRLPFKWKIVKNISSKVDNSLISEKKVKSILSKLEGFLRDENATLSNLLGKPISNFEALNFKLVGIKDANVKEQIKKQKIELNQKILVDFKLPIKKNLLNDLINKGDFLSAGFSNKEKNDLEGFVLSKGSELIKIVDRDLFTALNEFNYKIRNELSSAVMSNDINSPLLVKGGIFGNAKIRIASLFDLPELAKSAQAKKIFKSYKGKTVDQTLFNFTKTLHVKDVLMFKNKIIAILSDTENDLDKKLEQFKNEASTYKVTLKNGNEVSYSEESKKRTLLAFAELLKEISKIKSAIKSSKTIEEIINALYGKLIKAVHTGEKEEEEQMNESVENTAPAATTNNNNGFSLLKNLLLLSEDGEGGDGSGVSAAATAATTASAVSDAMPGATTSSMIATLPKRIFNGKVIKRIKRNYFPKKKKVSQ
jgi:hypothetical protein